MSEEIKTTSTIEPKTKSKVTKLGIRIVSVVFLLGTVGQIAWAIENTWFNTFVYDVITPNPRPIAWMVGVSAVIATLTTLFMGTLSDRTHTRFGKRKPYIFFGYILWGIVTIIFPLNALIETISIAVVMVIIIDAIMTFFGSTANDAAYNAWLTDVSDSSNRNRIQGFNAITILLANLIAIGTAGIIIIKFGYSNFFYIMGGVVSVIGFIAGLILREPNTSIKNAIPEKTKRKSFFAELYEIIKLENIKENKLLYILFINLAIINIGAQIFMPYLFIYIEYALLYTKDQLSLIGGIVILGAALVSLLVGLFSHRINRLVILYVSTILNAVFLIVFAFVRSLAPIILIYFFALSFQMAATIAHSAFLLDSYPKEKVGKFQGVRMIFFVAIPMTIGPQIGSAIIKNLGTPAIIDGKAGYIPPNMIFIAAGIVIFLSIIPLFFIKWNQGKIKFIEKNQLENNVKIKSTAT